MWSGRKYSRSFVRTASGASSTQPVTLCSGRQDAEGGKGHCTQDVKLEVRTANTLWPSGEELSFEDIGRVCLSLNISARL